MVEIDYGSSGGGNAGPHAATHKKNGSDAIRVDELADPTDNTNLNTTINAHGFAPKLPNDANVFLNGVGGWSAAAGGGTISGGTNLGVGQGNVFKDALGANLRYKTLKQGTNTIISDGATEVTIDSAYPPNADTTTKGLAELATDGENAANVVVQGNDSRLSNSRTPTTHATTHSSGGSDPVTLSNLAGSITDAQISPSTLTTSNTKTVTSKTINTIDNVLVHLGRHKYEIFKDGSTWYCRNSVTGIIDSSSASQTTVLQFAIDNALGKGILIKTDILLTTGPINCVDKYFTLEGETHGTSGAAAASGATVIRANFTGATGDAVFNCVNSGYTKQFFKNIVIDCNNAVDYGINAFGVRECEGWLEDVSIIQHKKSGIKMQACWMSSWYNPNIISASGTTTVSGSIGVEMVRPSGPACNTIRVYGGRIVNNDINVSLDGTNDIVFFGTALEGCGTSAVKTFNNANANKFYGCSTEYGQLSSKTVIDEGGNANLYHGLRFDAAHTAYNIITVRSTCKNLMFEDNLIQANAALTTATIIVEASATNIDFFGNKQLTNTPLTVSITDGSPDETNWLGNSFVKDRMRAGLRLGSNKLLLKEVDSNTIGVYADDETTRRNFLSNAILTSVLRSTGSVDMFTFTDSSTITNNSKNILMGTGFLQFSKATPPANAASNSLNVYVDTADTHLKHKDSVGTVIDITGMIGPVTGKRTGSLIGTTATNQNGLFTNNMLNTGGATTTMDNTNGCYTPYNTATTIGDNSAYRTNNNWTMRNFNPIIAVEFAISVATNNRAWIGFRSSNALPAIGDEPMISLSGVMLVQRSGDTTWQIATNSGNATSTFVDTGVTITAGTQYTLIIKADAANNKFQWSLNGSAFADLTTTIPAATTPLGFFMGNQTAEPVTHAIRNYNVEAVSDR